MDMIFQPGDIIKNFQNKGKINYIRWNMYYLAFDIIFEDGSRYLFTEQYLLDLKSYNSVNRSLLEDILYE